MWFQEPINRLKRFYNGSKRVNWKNATVSYLQYYKEYLPLKSSILKCVDSFTTKVSTARTNSSWKQVQSNDISRNWLVQVESAILVLEYVFFKIRHKLWWVVDDKTIQQLIRFLFQVFAAIFYYTIRQETGVNPYAVFQKSLSKFFS
jgi:hypothetical protein